MKRGQITIFIIVGIVILLVLGLGVAAWKYFSVERPPEDKIIEETNNELEPIRLFVKDCLDATGKEVFARIGLHGGYYDPQGYGYTAIPDQPTAGRAFEPFPGQVVPYWLYVSSPNDCIDCKYSSEQPPLEGSTEPAIQYQAERAIETQLMSCVNNFEQFEEQYVITPQSEPRVTVTFGESNTIFRLNYVLEVRTQAGSISTLRDFTTTIDLPFKSMYEIADKIRVTNEIQPYFEGITIEALTLLAADNQQIPPPYGETTLSYDPGPFWTLFETRERIANALEDKIGIVQLFGSQNMSYVSTSNATVNTLYQSYYFSIDDPAPAVEANFLYFADWDPYVRVHPGGQVIKPDVISMGLPFLPPMKRLEFDYDVSYPLLVQLQAPTSDGAYLFQFPLEINIRNTVPVTHEPIIVGAPVPAYCDPATWTGTVANITVHDTANRRLDANLRYECLNQACVLDKTVNGKLSTPLPVCLGGTITAEREGFVPTEQPLTSLSGNAEVDITMMRFTTVNVTADTYLLQKESYYDNLEFITNWFVATSNRFDVAPNQHLVVMFTPRENPALTEIAIFPGSEQKVKLYPTTYDISAVLMVNRTTPYVIPEETRCYDTGLFSGDECVTMPEITFGPSAFEDPETGDTHVIDSTSVYIGGLQWDATTKNITFTQEDLDRGALRVPVIAINLNDLEVVEDLEAFDQITMLSKDLELN